MTLDSTNRPPDRSQQVLAGEAPPPPPVAEAMESARKHLYEKNDFGVSLKCPQCGAPFEDLMCGACQRRDGAFRAGSSIRSPLTLLVGFLTSFIPMIALAVVGYMILHRHIGLSPHSPNSTGPPQFAHTISPSVSEGWPTLRE